MKTSITQAFQRHFEHRHWLRLHMCIILLATTLSGILSSKLLLILYVADFRFRYPLVVALSYLFFFACIRIWLSLFISTRRVKSSGGGWIDPPDSLGGTIKSAVQTFNGGGGRFGGAGASGTFEIPQQAMLSTATLQQSPPPVGSGASDAIGDVIGKSVGFLGDDDAIFAIIALVGLLVTILISAVVLLYSAPAILSEAAFNGVLAASLINKTRTISEKGWAESLFKTTWKPFAVTIVVAFVAGLVLHKYFPYAIRLADIPWRH